MTEQCAEEKDLQCWGCEFCYSFDPCNCEALIAQQDTEAKEAKRDETESEKV